MVPWSTKAPRLKVVPRPSGSTIPIEAPTRLKPRSDAALATDATSTNETTVSNRVMRFIGPPGVGVVEPPGGIGRSPCVLHYPAGGGRRRPATAPAVARRPSRLDPARALP